MIFKTRNLFYVFLQIFSFFFQIKFLYCDKMSSAPVTEMTTIPTEMIKDPSEIETENSIRKFDLRILRDAFVNCIQSDNTLLLGEYIRAYEELCM